MTRRWPTGIGTSAPPAFTTAPTRSTKPQSRGASCRPINRPAMSADTIDVREDERFDQARLAAYLSGRLPGAEQPLAVRQFGGGAANLTYLLSYGGREYVLRRPPLGPLARS